MIDADRREQLLRIYAESRTIAVVGASTDEMKAATRYRAIYKRRASGLCP